MELLRFLINGDGTIGAPYVESKKEKKKSEIRPGAALAALMEEDDDDYGDAPDVSADFARIGHLSEEEDEDALPMTADFAVNEDGTLTLTRWPRLARPAVVPGEIGGRAVTGIAACAFAVSHIDEEKFSEFFSSPISYSIFCMRMGRYITRETVDEGGPTELRLPDRLGHIGPYAFWHCDKLKSVTVPEGITELPMGVFGECAALEQVHLPESLQSIGYLPRPTDQVMPDVGVFAGCHSLKQLTLPAKVNVLGAHTFNSCGIVHLSAVGKHADRWGRRAAVAATAFDHSAALLWIDKISPEGKIFYRVGLPVARDKILAGDARFGSILRVPADFFTKKPEFFDALAQKAFRLDFSGRMALARLACPGGLSPEAEQWYFDLLIKYYDRAPQFMPGPAADSWKALFDFIEPNRLLTAADMSSLLRTAGLLNLPAELLSRMMEVRTKRFSTVTGFEDLGLDDLDDL